MSSISLLRIAARATCVRSSSVRAVVPRTAPAASSSVKYSVNQQPSSRNFSSTRRVAAAAAEDHGHGGHHEESFEEFSARYEKEFEAVDDVFELQRNLNNSFAYDLVPSPSVLTAALRAARRVNDFPTAVRLFEAIKAKVENKGQYEQYLEELKEIREELGIILKEDLYPDGP